MAAKDFVVKNGLIVGVDIIVNGTVDGRNVSVDGTKLDGVAAGATATTPQTASQILVKIKTVDGTLSGLDADLLDGQHASAFATALQGSNGQTAFTWGNHALGGYAPVVHTHTTSDITGLAAYITGNAAVLANTAKLTTNTTNVTTAGAVMDSELANIAAVKALNQQLTTTSSPTFGPIYINEQLAASADVVAKGQIWVKNTTPNQLWFTNDTGADVQLGAASVKVAASPPVSATQGNLYWDVDLGRMFIYYVDTTTGVTQWVDASPPGAGGGSGAGGSTDFGAVGAYQLAYYWNTATYVAPGNTVAGSALRYSNTSTTVLGSSASASLATVALTGTWRFMGQQKFHGSTGKSSVYYTGLFVRVS